MLEQGKATIVIEKPYGGIGNTFNPVNYPVIETTPTQYSRGSSVSLSRLGYEGHIAQGYTFTDVVDGSTVVNGLPLNAVVDSAGFGYFVLDTGRLVYYDLSNSSIPGTKADPTGVTSGTYSDVALYPYQTGTSPVNTTDEYVFWSWETNTYGDVALMKKSNRTGFTSNYLTAAAGTNGTALVHGVPHPILVGQDSNVYIGNGRYLASFDPTAGTVTVNYQALDLKPGWTISALSQYQNYIAILGYKQSTSLTGYYKSDTKVFFWDGFSPTWNFEYAVRDNYAGNMYYDGVDLHVISYGRNSTGKLKKFNGSGFETIFESPVVGGLPGIGGSESYLNHLVWGSSGNLFAHGAPSDRQESGFHFWAQPGTSRTGMVKNLVGQDLYLGRNTNSGFAISISNTLTGFDNTSAEFFSQLYVLPTNSTITCLKFYLSKFDSGSSFQYSVVKDYNASTYTASDNVLAGTIDYATYPAQFYIPIKKNLTNVTSFRLQVRWNGTINTAAIIRKIEVEYQIDQNNI